VGRCVPCSEPYSCPSPWSPKLSCRLSRTALSTSCVSAHPPRRIGTRVAVRGRCEPVSLGFGSGRHWLVGWRAAVQRGYQVLHAALQGSQDPILRRSQPTQRESDVGPGAHPGRRRRGAWRCWRRAIPPPSSGTCSCSGPSCHSQRALSRPRLHGLCRTHVRLAWLCTARVGDQQQHHCLCRR
jgi:hypothetical protein